MKIVILVMILAAFQISIWAGIDTDILSTNQVVLKSGKWIPTPEQTQKALASIQIFLTQNKHYDNAKILAHAKQYRVQFVGELRRGKKVIWCNFFPAPENNRADESPDWKRDKLQNVFDGGFWYWRFNYDPDTGTCSDFGVNGYA